MRHSSVSSLTQFTVHVEEGRNTLLFSCDLSWRGVEHRWRWGGCSAGDSLVLKFRRLHGIDLTLLDAKYPSFSGCVAHLGRRRVFYERRLIHTCSTVSTCMVLR